MFVFFFFFFFAFPKSTNQFSIYLSINLYNIALLLLNGPKCFLPFVSSFSIFFSNTKKDWFCVKVSPTTRYQTKFLNMVNAQRLLVYFILKSTDFLGGVWTLKFGFTRTSVNCKLCGLYCTDKTPSCCSKFNILLF